jgi:PilZ domain-containing protein
MSEQSVERERRRYLRVAVDEGLECDIEGVGVVHIVGVGSEGGGMRIITNKELPKDHELQIKLSRDEKSLFEGKAKAVWQEAWDFEFCSRYVVGVELLGLDEAERQALVSQIPTVSEPPDEMM